MSEIKAHPWSNRVPQERGETLDRLIYRYLRQREEFGWVESEIGLSLAEGGELEAAQLYLNDSDRTVWRYAAALAEHRSKEEARAYVEDRLPVGKPMDEEVKIDFSIAEIAFDLGFDKVGQAIMAEFYYHSEYNFLLSPSWHKYWCLLYDHGEHLELERSMRKRLPMKEGMMGDRHFDTLLSRFARDKSWLLYVWLESQMHQGWDNLFHKDHKPSGPRFVAENLMDVGRDEEAINILKIYDPPYEGDRGLWLGAKLKDWEFLEKICPKGGRLGTNQYSKKAFSLLIENGGRDWLLERITSTDNPWNEALLEWAEGDTHAAIRKIESISFKVGYLGSCGGSYKKAYKSFEYFGDAEVYKPFIEKYIRCLEQLTEVEGSSQMFAEVMIRYLIEMRQFDLALRIINNSPHEWTETLWTINAWIEAYLKSLPPRPKN